MKLRPVLAALAAALVVVACSDTEDGGTADSTTDTATADAGAELDAALNGDASDDTSGSSAGEPFPDTTFRIDGVNIIRPTGVGPILGNLITADIDDGVLHALVQFTGFAGPWPTTMRATGNVGQQVEGGYAWLDGVEIDRAEMEIDADGAFRGLESLSIVVPALEPGATEPLQIPALVTQFTGELFEFEGQWVIEGTLEGAILEEEIEGMTVNLGQEQSLSQLLGGPDDKDYPPGASGDELTGWSLEAEIGAVEVVFVEPM